MGVGFIPRKKGGITCRKNTKRSEIYVDKKKRNRKYRKKYKNL